MTVIVYSVPSCPKCAAAKALLKRKQVEFEEVDVKESKEKEQAMVQKLEKAGIPSDSIMMPILDIDGILIQGFERGKIENALKEKKLVE